MSKSFLPKLAISGLILSISLSINPIYSMEVETKSTNKTVKRNYTESLRGDAQDYHNYCEQSSVIALNVPDILVITLQHLEEKDQENLHLISQSGYAILLHKYDEKIKTFNIKEWYDLPGLTSRMNYSLSKQTATFLGLYQNLYKKRGEEIDRGRFYKLAAMFRDFNNGNKNNFLRSYSMILKKNIEILENERSSEASEKKMVLNLQNIIKKKSYHNEIALCIYDRLFIEETSVNVDELLNTYAKENNCFLMVAINNLVTCNDLRGKYIQRPSRANHESNNIAETLDKILSLDPGAPLSDYEDAAHIHYCHNNPLQASKYYEKIIDILSDRVTARNYWNAGISQFGLKNYLLAAKYHEKSLDLLQIEDNNPMADDYMITGDAHYYANNLEQAQNYYDVGIGILDINAEESDYWKAISAYGNDEKFPMASVHIKNYLKIYIPKNLKLRNRLKDFIDNERYEEAYNLFIDNVDNNISAKRTLQGIKEQPKKTGCGGIRKPHRFRPGTI